MTDQETTDVTFEIDGPDDDDDAATLTLPAALVDALAEPDETRAETVAAVSLQTFVSQAHHVVQHGDGEVPAELAAAEERALELFEERFGISFGEATGHQH